MRDVADEVLDLPFGERPRRPIADRLRFRQPHAANAAHQIGERNLHAVAEKRRSDLRIEDARRHEIEAIGEDLQVCRERVSDDRRLRERAARAAASPASASASTIAAPSSKASCTTMRRGE